MGRSFRPVREEWGPSTDTFVHSEYIAALLESIAIDAGSTCEQLDYGQDITALYVENGAKFLDALTSDQFTVETAKAHLEEMGYDDRGITEDDLAALVGNVKGLVEAWRRSIGSDGELRFYIDNY